MLVDSHAHLDFQDFDQDRAEALDRAKTAGVHKIICIGAGDALNSAHRSLALSAENDFIYSTVGIHPHDAKIWNSEISDELIHLGQKPRQVAIGEIGLDFAKEYSPKEIQEKAFREQLEIALELDLPVIIHSRNALGETMNILKEMKIKRGLMHCYSGSADLAKELVRLGFYISIPGVITFKKAQKLALVVREIGLDHLLIETDCPFLAPEPFRGKRNEPAYVKLVAQKIAEIKGIAFEKVAEKTTENAEQIFGLDRKQ